MEFIRRKAEKGPGVAFGMAGAAEKLYGLGRELQQPQLVGHRRLGLADLPGHRLLAQAGSVDKGLEGLSLLPEVQIPPLDIFNERQQGGLLGVYIDDDTGYLTEPGQPGSPKPTLPGNELVAVGAAADGEGLEDTVLGNALGELLQTLLGKVLPGLVGVGGQNGNWQREYLVAFEKPLLT